MGAGWRVGVQRQFDELVEDGRFVPTIEVPVVMDSGTRFTLRVPVSRYSAEYVQSLIEERVAHMLAVESL